MDWFLFLNEHIGINSARKQNIRLLMSMRLYFKQAKPKFNEHLRSILIEDWSDVLIKTAKLVKRNI